MIYKQGANAKTITTGLLDRLNILTRAGKPTNHEIEQILFSAQKLLKVEAGSFYYIKGICECLRGNVEAMREAFETAFQLDPGPDIYDGYNLALSYSYLHRDVVQRHLAVLRNEDSDPQYVAIAAEGILGNGLVKDYLELAVPKLNRYGFKSSEHKVVKFMNAMARSGLSQEDVIDVVFSSLDAFAEEDANIYFRQSIIDYSEDEINFIVRVEVHGAAKELNILESTVISKLISKDLPAYNHDLVSVLVAPIQG